MKDDRQHLAIGAVIIDDHNEHMRYWVDGIISKEGSSSIVYSGRDNEGRHVVIKEFYPMEHSIGRLEDGSLDYVKEKYQKDIDLFEKQADINNHLFRLDNGTYSVYFSEMRVIHANRTSYLVTLHDRQTSFSTYLKERINGKERRLDTNRYSFNERLSDIRNILEIVKMLHERGYIHGDMKPSNLMRTDARVGDTVFMAPIDFGSCIDTDDVVSLANITNSMGFCLAGWRDLCIKIKVGIIDEDEAKKEVCEIGTYADLYSVAAIFSLLIFGGVKNSFLNTDEMFRSELFNSWDLGPAQKKFLRKAVDLMFDEKINGKTGINVYQLDLLLGCIAIISDESTALYSINKKEDFRRLRNSGLIHMGSNEYEENIIRDSTADAIIAELNRCQIYKAELKRFSQEEKKVVSAFRNSFVIGEDKYHFIIHGTLNGKSDVVVEDSLIQDIDKNVFIYGESGYGKSWICASVYRHYISTGELIPIYCNANDSSKYKGDLIEQITAELFHSTEYSELLRNELLRTKEDGCRYVLLIDNFDAIPSDKIVSADKLVNDINTLGYNRVAAFGKNPVTLGGFRNKIALTGVNINDYAVTTFIPDRIFKIPFFLAQYMQLKGGDISRINVYKGGENVGIGVIHDFIRNGRENCRVLIETTLPYLAYISKSRETEAFPLEELEEQSMRDAGRYYNGIELSGIIAQLVTDGILSKKEESIGFAHEIFRNYFIGYYIALRLRDLIDKSNRRKITAILSALDGSWDKREILYARYILRDHFGVNTDSEVVLSRFSEVSEALEHVIDEGAFDIDNKQQLARASYNIALFLLKGRQVLVAMIDLANTKDGSLESSRQWAGISLKLGYETAANLIMVSNLRKKETTVRETNLLENALRIAGKSRDRITCCNMGFISYAVRKDLEEAISYFKYASFGKAKENVQGKAATVITIISILLSRENRGKPYKSLIELVFSIMVRDFDEIIGFLYKGFTPTVFDMVTKTLCVIYEDKNVVRNDDMKYVISRLIGIGIPYALEVQYLETQNYTEKKRILGVLARIYKASGDGEQLNRTMEEVFLLYAENDHFSDCIELCIRHINYGMEEFHILLGYLYILDGNLEKAEESLLNRIEQGSIESQYYYAELLSKQGKDPVSHYWAVIKAFDGTVGIKNLKKIKEIILGRQESYQNESFTLVHKELYMRALSGIMQSSRSYIDEGTDYNYYIGEANDNNELDGFGVAITEDWIYVGEWEKWKRDSSAAILLNSYGHLYIGGFQDDKKSGTGILLQNKYLTIGTFSNDMRKGSGILADSSKLNWTSAIEYAGWFNNDFIEGEGIYLRVPEEVKQFAFQEGLWDEGDLIEEKNIDRAKLLDSLFENKYITGDYLLSFYVRILMAYVVRVLEGKKGEKEIKNGSECLKRLHEIKRIIDHYGNCGQGLKHVDSLLQSINALDDWYSRRAVETGDSNFYDLATQFRYFRVKMLDIFTYPDEELFL